VDAFWNIVDWKAVNDNFGGAANVAIATGFVNPMAGRVLER
jgi:hypothetical protein